MDWKFSPTSLPMKAHESLSTARDLQAYITARDLQAYISLFLRRQRTYFEFLLQ